MEKLQKILSGNFQADSAFEKGVSDEDKNIEVYVVDSQKEFSSIRQF